MMCDTPTLLANINNHRFIAHCPCGCLHLVWDNATIRLDQADLGNVLCALQHPAPASRSHITVSAEAGAVQVWLLSAGLNMTPAEFGAFQELLGRARAQLEPHADLASASPRRGKHQECRQLN